MSANPASGGDQRASKAAARAALSRRPPARAAVQALIRTLEPGATLIDLRRLKGGISTRTFAVRYRGLDGRKDAVVLRVYVPGNHFSGPVEVEREWKTLDALSRTPVPAPRPLLLDLEGRHFGGPCMLVSLLPGAPLPSPRDAGVFLHRLAEALAEVHKLGPSTPGLGHLQTSHKAAIRGQLSRDIAPDLEKERIGRDVWSALQRSVGAVSWQEPALAHDDFWPGNTLWYRGRMSGVVDWSTAEFGDHRTDVAQCRVDLALMYGLDWADAFAGEYERVSRSKVRDLWFWDLYRARGALTSVPYFYEGYRDLGLRDVTLALLQDRLEAFVKKALAASKSAATFSPRPPPSPRAGGRS